MQEHTQTHVCSICTCIRWPLDSDEVCSPKISQVENLNHAQPSDDDGYSNKFEARRAFNNRSLCFNKNYHKCFLP